MQKRIAFKSKWGAAGSIFAICLAFILLDSIVRALMSTMVDETNTYYVLWWLLPGELIAGGGLWFVLRFLPKTQPMHPWRLMNFVWVIICYCFVRFIVAAYAAFLLKWMELPQYANEGVWERMLSVESSWQTLLVSALMLIIVVPIYEEFVFRYVLYRHLRRHIGIALATIISTLFFTVLHLSFDVAKEINIIVFLNIFALGVALALIFEYSKNIWSAILLHVLNNILAVAVIVFLA